MDEHRITIERLTHGPYGLGHLEGKVILVPRTAPGDSARVRIREDRKRYAVGELVSLVEPGASRTAPPCPYVEGCGGCSWQQVAYTTQLSSKQQNVADALARIAKLPETEVLPILPGSAPFHYRRRIRLHRGAHGFGFRRHRSHDVVPVERCLIAQPSVSDAVPLAARWAAALATHIASIEIVESGTAEIILVGRAEGGFHESDERVCRELHDAELQLAGIVLSARNWRRHWGEDRISYAIDANTGLWIDADAFSQINTHGNRRLIEELLQWNACGRNDRVLELYSGAGNLTVPMARKAGHVVAVEAHEALVRNGIENARRHGLGNVEWRWESAQSAVTHLVREGETFETIVLNPPRSGAKEIVGHLRALSARTILYVACDPVTMARDLGQLARLGYRLRRVQPFDLFPQTHHVEILAELTASVRPNEGMDAPAGPH